MSKEIKMYCCERCQVYWSCELKWYRGEKNEEDICCSTCNFYNACLSKAKQQKRKADK